MVKKNNDEDDNLSTSVSQRSAGLPVEKQWLGQVGIRTPKSLLEQAKMYWFLATFQI